MVQVEYEYGALRAAIVGCMDGFRLPRLSDGAGLPAMLQNWEIIDVTYEEARALACNGLVLDMSSYIIDRAHARLAERLAAKNIDVITTPFDLPARFGGGLRCVHHPLVRI